MLLKFHWFGIFWLQENYPVLFIYINEYLNILVNYIIVIIIVNYFIQPIFSSFPVKSLIYISVLSENVLPETECILDNVPNLYKTRVLI